LQYLIGGPTVRLCFSGAHEIVDEGFEKDLAALLNKE